MKAIFSPRSPFPFRSWVKWYFKKHFLTFCTSGWDILLRYSTYLQHLAYGQLQTVTSHLLLHQVWNSKYWLREAGWGETLDWGSKISSLRVKAWSWERSQCLFALEGPRFEGNFYLDNKPSIAKEAINSLPPYFFTSCSLLEVPRTINPSNVLWIRLKFSFCLCSLVRRRQPHGSCLWLQASLKSFGSCNDPQQSYCFTDDSAPLSWWSNAGISLVRTTSTKMSLFASWSNKSNTKNSTTQEFCSR